MKEQLKINVSTDIAVTIGGSKIVLIKRLHEPFKDKLCLPGGFFEPDEDNDLLSSCARETREEIGLVIDIRSLMLLTVLSEKGRDPRPWGPRISVVYWKDISEEESENLRAGDDAKEIVIRDLDRIKPEEIGFDHFDVIQELKKWL